MTGASIDIDRLADLVAERVVEQLAPPLSGEVLLGADEVARRLNVERDYVYRHAVRLGARRLGAGDRGRLRFLWADVLEAVPCSASRGAESPEPRIQPARRRHSRSSTVELLPIRGGLVPKSPVREAS